MNRFIDCFQNLFPYHIFFCIQILAAELMFAVRQKKRKEVWWYVPLCCFIFLVICLLHPLMGHRYVRVLAIFFESCILIYILLNISLKSAIFIGLASYAIQNLANQTGKWITEELEITGGIWFYILTLIIYVLIYIACYFAFVKRFPLDGKVFIKSRNSYFLIIVTLGVVYARSIYIQYNQIPGERPFTILCIILILALQFHILKETNEEELRKNIEAILEREKQQQKMSQENIEIINMKCHDLRYHIQKYREENHLEEHVQFFKEVEKAVDIYDNIARTGNAALDTLLSDKFLYARANQVEISYMVDEKAIEFMVPSDIYSLFGNAIDNALQSLMKEDEGKRILSILVRMQLGCVQIRISNYCSSMPEIVDGMPKTKGDPSIHGFGVRSIRYIAEKYGGNLVVGTEDNMFTLSILIPLQIS